MDEVAFKAQNVKAAMAKFRAAFAEVEKKMKLDVQRAVASTAACRSAKDPFDLGHGTAEDYARVVLHYMPWVQFVDVESPGQLTVRVTPKDARHNMLPVKECEDLRRMLMRRAPVGTLIEVPGRPDFKGAFALNEAMKRPRR